MSNRWPVVSGIGQSRWGRRLQRSGILLTVDACRAALEHAGLVWGDIDGVAAFPGQGFDMPGFAGPGTREVIEALGLEVRWNAGGPEGGQLSGFVNACLAVSSGLARHCLVYRTTTEARAQGTSGRSGKQLVGSADGPVEGFRKHLAPFGAVSPANWVGLYATRHMALYGTTREQLGAVALNARANAGRNPEAVYKSPLTMEEYLAARMISTPFGLYDCDVPIDGSVAFIVSDPAYVADAPQPPVQVEAFGTASVPRVGWGEYPGMPMMVAEVAADHLWGQTDMKAEDVDVAALYDGFSYLTLMWLEALGFCKPGESGPFVEGGERIALNGELPLATGGGQLSAGRLHGCGHLFEACVQLFKLGGNRQVAKAEVAIVGSGGGGLANAVLLTSCR